MPFLSFPWQTQVIDIAWFVFVFVWVVAARSVKTTAVSEGPASRALHVIPLIVAAWLLAVPSPMPLTPLNEPLWAQGAAPAGVGAILTAAGIAFAIWARFVLGRNWSANVTQKTDHELIQSGPFALVRHPIYTGLLLAFLGTAVAVDEWRGILAFVVATVAILRKYRVEERFMTELFGERYAAYRARVPALVPFPSFRTS